VEPGLRAKFVVFSPLLSKPRFGRCGLCNSDLDVGLYSDTAVLTRGELYETLLRVSDPSVVDER
jgi:hypothetical protein